MANYRYGSAGDDVKALQNKLIAAGYDVGKSGADGVFGKDTLAAVKKFQKNNGLAVDGIAGKNTLAALNSNNNTTPLTSAGATKPTNRLPNNSKDAQAVALGGGTTGMNVVGNTKSNTNNANKGTKPNLPDVNTGKTDTSNVSNAPTTQAPTTQPPAAGATTTTTVAPFTYEDFNYGKEFTYDDFKYDKQFSYDPFSYDKQFSYDPFSYGDFSYADYAESDTVKQAHALLQQQIASKPGAYQSQWQSQINDYMNQIENRDPFSYDFNSDALYNQYKDQYIQQGQMAMMDTMGQAAAMTGGYGNSYAQTVGQQAYNQQLNQLNNIMPELYGMAYDRYADEGQRLQDMYSMYVGLENQDYGRYQDNLSNWYNQLDYLTGRYDAERDADYSRWESDRNLAYDQYTSDRNYAYDQWQSGRDLAFDQYAADKNLAYDQWQSGRDLAYDEYVADRNLAYDQYTAGRDLAWDQYLANQEKEQAAAELMAGAGNYDRLAQIYGLSADEVKAIKDANTPKATPTPGKDSGDGEGTYTTLKGSELDEWEKRFQRAESIEDVEWYTEQLVPIIGPSAAAAWHDRYAAKFITPTPTHTPTSTPTGSWRDQEEYWRKKGSPIMYTM